MKNKKYIIIFLLLIRLVFNGINVAELKTEEETDSECYNTQNPNSINDCIDQEIDEEDSYCCLFEIETHRKEKKKRCAGLTQFQYEHIKLYVREKMENLLYRNLDIHCNSLILNKKMIAYFLPIILVL